MRRQQCRRFTPSTLPQTPDGCGRTRSRLRLVAALHRSPGSRTGPLPRRRDRPHDWMRLSQNNWRRHPMPMPGRQGRPIEGGSLIRRALVSSLQDHLFDGVASSETSSSGRQAGSGAPVVSWTITVERLGCVSGADKAEYQSIVRVYPLRADLGDGHGGTTPLPGVRPCPAYLRRRRRLMRSTRPRLGLGDPGSFPCRSGP